MRALKTKTFARWARKEGLLDPSLTAAVDEMRRGLVDARLGAGLVKKRVARSGGGKSAGFRALVATDLNERWVFLYGFAKSERDNLDEEEVARLKVLARTFLGMSEDTVQRLVWAGELMEVKYG